MNERSHLEMVRDWVIIVFGSLAAIAVIFG